MHFRFTSQRSRRLQWLRGMSRIHFMNSLFSLAAVTVAFSCGAATAQAPPKKRVIDPDAFIGLLEDLRRSELVVKLRIDKVTFAGDNEKEVLEQRFAILDGAVLAVFKGK